MANKKLPFSFAELQAKLSEVVVNKMIKKNDSGYIEEAVLPLSVPIKTNGKIVDTDLSDNIPKKVAGKIVDSELSNNIMRTTTFKTVAGNAITGTGDITFKTISGADITGTGDISVTPTATTWAARPTAASSTGRTIRVTDYNNALFYSNGIDWETVGRQCIYNKDFKNINTPVTGTGVEVIAVATPVVSGTPVFASFGVGIPKDMILQDSVVSYSIFTAETSPSATASVSTGITFTLSDTNTMPFSSFMGANTTAAQTFGQGQYYLRHNVGVAGGESGTNNRFLRVWNSTTSKYDLVWGVNVMGLQPLDIPTMGSVFNGADSMLKITLRVTNSSGTIPNYRSEIRAGSIWITT